MKQYAIIICCLALSAPFARSQAQSGGQTQPGTPTQSPNSSGSQPGGTLTEPRVAPIGTPSSQNPQTRPEQPGTFGAGSSATADRERENSGAQRQTVDETAGSPRTLGTPPLTSSATNRVGSSITPTPATVEGATDRESSTTSAGAAASVPSVNSSTSVPDSTATASGVAITDPSGGSTDNPGDRSLTQKLRQALTSESSTGVEGANVSSPQSDIKIMSRNGMVTLRGNVKNEGQKRSIEARLKNVEGVTSIKNELRVSANEDSAAETKDSVIGDAPVTKEQDSSLKSTPDNKDGLEETKGKSSEKSN